MIPYYILFFLLFACFVGNQQLVGLEYSRRVSKLFGFLIIFLLVFYAGLRYGVGTDYYNYYQMYDYYKEAPLKILEEPGIIVIGKISAILHDDPATMMFICAAITIIPMIITIFKKSNYYWISVLLYIFLGIWQGCFNGVRQYLAAAILFTFHQYLIDRKFLKWLLVVLIASLFHVSAIVALSFYFFPKGKINIKKILMCIVIIFIGIRLYDYIFSFVEFIKQDPFDFEGAGSGYLLNAINPLRILVQWVPILFYIVFSKSYADIGEEENFYINMALLNAVLMTVAMQSAYFGRIGIYTSIYTTIAWPILLSRLDSRSFKIVLMVMLVLFFGYWYVQSSGPTLCNFRWIWQR